MGSFRRGVVNMWGYHGNYGFFSRGYVEIMGTVEAQMGNKIITPSPVMLIA